MGSTLKELIKSNFSFYSTEVQQRKEIGNIFNSLWIYEERIHGCISGKWQRYIYYCWLFFSAVLLSKFMKNCINIYNICLETLTSGQESCRSSDTSQCFQRRCLGLKSPVSPLNYRKKKPKKKKEGNTNKCARAHTHIYIFVWNIYIALTCTLHLQCISKNRTYI